MYKNNITRLLNEHRALIMLLALFFWFSFFAPNFFSIHNMGTILKASSLNGITAIGFTLVLILGQLDLSIGAVAMLAGMLAVGLQPQFWLGGFHYSSADSWSRRGFCERVSGGKRTD